LRSVIDRGVRNHRHRRRRAGSAGRRGESALIGAEGASPPAGPALRRKGTSSGSPGSAARVFRSMNRGNTWSAADLPLRKQRHPARFLWRWIDRATLISGGDYRHPEESESCVQRGRRHHVAVLPFRQQSYFAVRLSQPIGVLFWEWAAHTPPTLTMWEAESGRPIGT
jgi:hypothetical protein